MTVLDFNPSLKEIKTGTQGRNLKVGVMMVVITVTRSNRGCQGMWLILPYHSPPLKKVRELKEGRNWKQALMQRPRRMPLLGLLLVVLLRLRIESRTTSPGVGPFTMCSPPPPLSITN